MSITTGSSSSVVFVADNAYTGIVHSRSSPLTVPVMNVFPEGWKHYTEGQNGSVVSMSYPHLILDRSSLTATLHWYSNIIIHRPCSTSHSLINPSLLTDRIYLSSCGCFCISRIGSIHKKVSYLCPERVFVFVIQLYLLECPFKIPVSLD